MNLTYPVQQLRTLLTSNTFTTWIVLSTLEPMINTNAYKVSVGNGFVKVFQTVVWVNSRQIGSTVHTQVLDTLVSLWEVKGKNERNREENGEEKWEQQEKEKGKEEE